MYNNAYHGSRSSDVVRNGQRGVEIGGKTSPSWTARSQLSTAFISAVRSAFKLVVRRRPIPSGAASARTDSWGVRSKCTFAILLELTSRSGLVFSAYTAGVGTAENNQLSVVVGAKIPFTSPVRISSIFLVIMRHSPVVSRQAVIVP